MSKDEKKVEAFNAADLKEKFKEKLELLEGLNGKAKQLQQEFIKTQELATKTSGAAELTINMLAEIIGKEEAQKFAEGIKVK